MAYTCTVQRTCGHKRWEMEAAADRRSIVWIHLAQVFILNTKQIMIHVFIGETAFNQFTGFVIYAFETQFVNDFCCKKLGTAES